MMCVLDLNSLCVAQTKQLVCCFRRRRGRCVLAENRSISRCLPCIVNCHLQPPPRVLFRTACHFSFTSLRNCQTLKSRAFLPFMLDPPWQVASRPNQMTKVDHDGHLLLGDCISGWLHKAMPVMAYLAHSCLSVFQCQPATLFLCDSWPRCAEAVPGYQSLAAPG